ncbi:MAG: LemA family protein [Bacteroidaceae bacterium]|nr:LemA family protein [Bacteroidaceae bacterium]
MSTPIIITVIVVAVILLYFVNTQRSLVNLDEMCKNALGQIEVQLNSRWDALLALAKTAAQYSKHESETLINVIQQRRGENVNTPEAVAEQQGALQQVMGRLIAIGEAYPDLKAADLFKETQAGVKEYEEHVRMSRMIYNDTATKMNRMVRQWPSSIVASALHFEQREYLKTDEPQKHSYPNLDEAFK